MRGFALTAFAVGAAALVAQEPRFRVAIQDVGPVVVGEIRLPIDPAQRIQIQHGNSSHFGLTVDGKRITCSPQGSIWPVVRVDGSINNAGFGGFGGAQPVQVRPLAQVAGKPQRVGYETQWTFNDVVFTQTVETVPGRPPVLHPGEKRRRDTARITYVAVNKGNKPREVGVRSNIDILIVNNDGALYMAPNEPKILNGVALEGKKLPPYLHVLERPDVTNPGFVATMTLKFGSRVEGPNKVVLTQLGQLGQQGWEVQPVMAGDSACAVYFETKTLRPGERREMVWAYGGGIASDLENEGRVSLTVEGNAEPGKTFTISALVEDPLQGQTLRLELPPGVRRLEGAETQPVAPPTFDGAVGNGYALWKARVLAPGDHPIRVHSSAGVVQTKIVSVHPVGAAP